MAEPTQKRMLSADWAVGEVDQLFSRIARYTRFVVFGKWFLTGFALLLITTLIALPLISKDSSGIRISMVDRGKSDAKPASAPVMSNPEYSGSDAKGQQYTVRGVRATQLSQSIIRMEQVEGQLLGTTGAWRALSALTATYDQQKKTILLNGEVTLIDAQGYQFITEEALVKSDSMEVTGNKPVTGVGPLGNLLASRFEIRDSGRHIIFYGDAQPVRLRIERKLQKRP